MTDQKELLDNLLDGIYELEGLVQLSLRKPEEFQKFKVLINNKFDNLKERVDRMNAFSGSDSVPVDCAPVECAATNHDVDELVSDNEGLDIYNKQKNCNKNFDKRRKVAHPRELFSINDLFLYSSELFDKRLLILQEALNQISEMEDFNEAHHYLLSEFKLDEENSEVQDFLNIIERYFN